MVRKLTYEDSYYYPYNLREYMKTGKKAKAEVRKEYTKLRDIAQKRLKRFSGTMWERTKTYKKYANKFKKLSDIKSESELASRLSELSNFIESSYSTISSQAQIMEKSLAKLHEDEYFFVNEENYIDFGEFMEEYRDQMLDEQYDSDQAAETFNELERHRVDPRSVKENFEYWLANKETLKKLPTGKGKKIIESTLKNRLDKYAKKMKIKLEEV